MSRDISGTEAFDPNGDRWWREGNEDRWRLVGNYSLPMSWNEVCQKWGQLELVDLG